MSKDHLSAIERERKKVTILLHGALTTVLNGLEEKDYPNVFVSTSTSNLSSILFDENKFMEQFKLMFNDEDRRLTIFDKALCLAMSLERNKVITTNNSKSRVPKRMTNLNEKLITETVIGYVGHSSYHLRRTDIEGDFSLYGFNEGHKTELKHLKDMLTEEFLNGAFDYNKCHALLYDLYLRGVCYSQGLSTEMIESIRKRITIKEKYDSPVVTVQRNNTYSEYRKSFRRIK